MTSKEFVIWLKGFAKAANTYNITPAQWEAIMEELNRVQEGLTFPDYKPSLPVTPNEPLKWPGKPIDVWYSTDTNSIPKDKKILND